MLIKPQLKQHFIISSVEIAVPAGHRLTCARTKVEFRVIHSQLTRRNALRIMWRMSRDHETLVSCVTVLGGCGYVVCHCGGINNFISKTCLFHCVTARNLLP